MKERRIYWFLAAEAAICAILALALPSGAASNGFMLIMQFPFAQIGQGLRGLSLSGTVGNTAAVLLYVALCLSPLVPAAWRIIKKRFCAADALLFVLSGFAFYMMYMMVNPSYFISRPEFPIDIGFSLLGGVCYSIIIGYVVLRLLRSTNDAPTQRLLKSLRMLLGVMAAVVVASVCYIGLGDLKAQFDALQSANTDASVSLGATYFFLCLRFALASLPELLMGVLFIKAMRLCSLINEDRYSESVIAAAQQLTVFCKRMVAAVLVGYISLNLLQVIFMDALVSSHFTATVPFDAIMLAFAMMLFTRLLTDGRNLKNDNALFI